MSLVQELMPDPTNTNERMIKGCQVLVPETVFFNEGRIEFMTASDKENCLAYDVKTKLVNQDVLKKLKELVYERRKDTQFFGKQKSRDSLSQRRLNPKDGLESYHAQKMADVKNAATVIVKYRDEDDPQLLSANVGPDYLPGLSEILPDREVTCMFDKKLNSKEFNWRTVEYV